MNRSIARRVTAVCALVLATVLGTAAPATAAGDQWWYDTYQVDKNHAAGWTGEGVKIAVIDHGINPDLPVFTGTNLTVEPEALCEGRSVISSDMASAQHGSTVAAVLIGNGQGAAGIRGIVPDAELTFFGIGPEPAGSETNTCVLPAAAGDTELSALGWGIQRAMDSGADIISISVGFTPQFGDPAVVAEALARGIVIVGAVYNPGTEFADLTLYPASFRGVVAVNGMDENRSLPIDSIYGLPHRVSGTTVVAAGVDISVIGRDGDWDAVGTASGSSFAAPLVAGMIAATAQKYPEATGNQLLQSLIHNTGTTDHPLEFSDDDGFGYGLASYTHMLSVDPTQYDDVNPLLDKSYTAAGGEDPSDEQLAAAMAAVAAASSPSPTVDPGAEPVSDDGGMISGVVVAVVVVVVLLIGAAVVTIVIITRNSRKNRPRSLQ